VVGKVTGSVALRALAVGGIGALAMSSKIKLAIGGIVALAATAVIVQYARNDGAKRVDRGAPMQTHELAPAVEAKPPPVNATDPSTTTAERALDPATPAASDITAPFVVRGRTLNFAGKPLGHLHVKLARFDGYETDGKPQASAVVASDGDGAFAWGLPLPRGTVTLTAAVTEADFFGDPAKQLVFGGDPPKPIDVTFHAIDCEIVGRVTGEGEASLGDALVKSWIGAESECDENGEYRLRAASTLGQIYVSASAPDHVAKEEFVDVRGATHDKPVTMNFRLRPGGTITGRVSDPSGAPIAGAKVTTHHAWLGRATTGDDGRYELSGVDPQQPELWLLVRHPDFAPGSATVTPAGARVEQDFVLQRGATVTGFVVDADGTPARGASVWVGVHPRMEATPHVLAHDDGSFTFNHVNVGVQKAGAELAGRPSIEQPATVPAEPPRLDGIELRFSAGHALAGRVEDKEGKPVAGASILTRRNVSDYDASARTDEKGHFELHAVPAETRSVEAWAAGFEMATRSDFTLDRDDLVIVLTHAGGLAGTVVDAESGAPLERFRIRFVEPRARPDEPHGTHYESTWHDPGRTFTATKGTWTTRGEALPLGSIFGIEASAEGFAPTYALHVVATGSPDPSALVLRLGRGATVVGTVVDADGAPIVGANVRLFAGQPPTHSWTDANIGDPRWNVRTTANGSFSIDGAAAGEGWLLVMGGDSPAQEDGPFDVPASGTTTRTIRLERGGAIDGIALDAAGKPCANRQLFLFDVREAGTGAPPRSATTDSDGRFRFSGLRPGSLQVSLVLQRASQSVNEMSARVTVVAGATASVRLEAKGDARVRGRIVGDLAAIDGVTVDLHRLGPPDSKEAVAATEEDGMVADRGLFADGDRFEVGSLPAGRYSVSAYGRGKEGQGYWFGRAEVRIAAGGDADVVVTLARSR